MVNLEEIKGEHKKLYITPQLVIEYLDLEDVVTTSTFEGPGNDGTGGNPGNPNGIEDL